MDLIPKIYNHDHPGSYSIIYFTPYSLNVWADSSDGMICKMIYVIRIVNFRHHHPDTASLESWSLWLISLPFLFRPNNIYKPNHLSGTIYYAITEIRTSPISRDSFAICLMSSTEACYEMVYDHIDGAVMHKWRSKTCSVTG